MRSERIEQLSMSRFAFLRRLVFVLVELPLQFLEMAGIDADERKRRFLATWAHVEKLKAVARAVEAPKELVETRLALDLHDQRISRCDGNGTSSSPLGFLSCCSKLRPKRGSMIRRISSREIS